MAIGDLAALKVHLHAEGPGTQSALGMQSITTASNWRSLLATQFKALVIPAWMDCLSFDVYMENITVTDVVPGTAADVILGGFPQPQGTAVSQAAPANAAYVISWRSDEPGRSKRGRTYLFGMPELSVVGTLQWDSSQQSAVEALAGAIMSRYGPSGTSTLARLCVISRGPKDAPLVPPVAYRVTTALFTPEIRSMRKRLRFS